LHEPAASLFLQEAPALLLLRRLAACLPICSAILLQEAAVPFKRPQPIYDENALYEYAVRALGRKMRTVAELKRLMRQRVPEGEIGALLVEMVVLRLKEQKYLSDSSYAASYASLRRDSEKFGRRRVITDLKVKGVHPDVIEKEVSEAYSSVDEQELARAFLKRKRFAKPENNKEVARIFRALLRAGFNAGIAIKVLKNWNVEDEVLAALEEESAESHDSAKHNSGE
jgi:regulatory protein